MRVLEALRGAVNDTDPDRARFREFIGKVLDQGVDLAFGDLLAILIRTAPSAELRRLALELLAEVSQELSLAPLGQALDDPRPAIRQPARGFYDELQVDALLDAVAGALLDHDPSTRLVALSTLEDLSRVASIQEIAAGHVNDPDPVIRMRALELITYGDEEGAIDYLLAALGDPHPRVSELADSLLTEYEQGP